MKSTLPDCPADCARAATGMAKTIRNARSRDISLAGIIAQLRSRDIGKSYVILRSARGRLRLGKPQLQGVKMSRRSRYAWISAFLLTAALAQDVTQNVPKLSGFTYWPAAKLKSYPSVLKAKEPTVRGTTKTMMAAERLGDHGGYSFMEERRDVDGVPEIHAHLDDVFIVQDGEATLLYGGTMQKVAAGDLAVVPAGMPHHTILPKGKSYTFMVIKIEKK